MSGERGSHIHQDDVEEEDGERVRAGAKRRLPEEERSDGNI